MPLAEAVRDAYLTRLGLEPEPPSAEALFRLHRAHAERVPYETLWIHAGERWDVDVETAARRIGSRAGAATASISTARSVLSSTSSVTR